MKKSHFPDNTSDAANNLHVEFPETMDCLTYVQPSLTYVVITYVAMILHLSTCGK